MSEERTIKWTGKSGTEYLYWIHSIETTFEPSTGNYVFAKETKPRTFTPIYVGETGDLSERFENHHKMDCIKRREATHICIHKSSDDEEERRAEEADIVDKWDPPCNG